MTLEGIIKGTKRHFITALAQVAPTAPFMTLADVMVSGNTAEQSLDARAASVGITLAGATVYDMAREGYLKWSEAEKGKDANYKTALRDATLNGFTFAIGALGSYYLAGVRDPYLLGLNAVTTGTIGLLTGPLVGRSTDILKDWFNIESCLRLSPAIRNRSFPQKIALTTLAAAASVGLTVRFAYMNSSDKEQQPLSYQQNP